MITIRPATHADISPIHALISADARRGGLLPRSIESITKVIDDFAVAEERTDDRRPTTDEESVLRPPPSVIGCGALAPMSPNLVELRSLAVDKSMRGKGVGHKLVAYLVDQAHIRHFGTGKVRHRHPVARCDGWIGRVQI